MFEVSGVGPYGVLHNFKKFDATLSGRNHWVALTKEQWSNVAAESMTVAFGMERTDRRIGNLCRNALQAKKERCPGSDAQNTAGRTNCAVGHFKDRAEFIEL